MNDRSVYLETFGCQMNELDSELVAGRLAALGYKFTDDAESADVVLYNTCSVREQAEQKVWSRLGSLRSVKAERPGMVVGVLGCMAERDGKDLIDRMPVVDLMCGPAELDKLPDLVDNAVRTRESLVASDADDAAKSSAKQISLQGNTSRRSSTLAAAADDLERLDLSRSISPTDASGPRRTAYVRITRGCNKFCTYCVVPFTRGAEVHRPPDHIVDECKKLADAGVIEVTLLGQTVNHYRFEGDAQERVDGIVQPQKGRTYKGSHHRDAFEGKNVTTFADLLWRIHEEVPQLKRIRFVTSYPRDFGNDVLQVLRDGERFCRYLHVPAQTGSDRMLKKMNRGYDIAEYDEFIARAREYLDQPEIGRPLMLSGDIIVGFPTETDDEFAMTVDLVQRSRYKNCFIFKYSPRPGTVAYDKIPDDVPEKIKRERNNHLLAVQAEISDQIAQEQIGREFPVLIEGPSRKAVRASGKTQGDIDRLGAVTLTVGGRSQSATLLDVPADESIQLSARTDGDLIVFVDQPGSEIERLVGTIANVRVTSADGLSLFGEMV